MTSCSPLRLYRAQGCHVLWALLPDLALDNKISSQNCPLGSREANTVLAESPSTIFHFFFFFFLPRGLLEDKNFQAAVNQSLVEQVPYFCQFWNEQSARFLAHKSSLYLMPVLSLPSSCYENGKGKVQGKDKCSSGKDAEEEEDEDEEEEREEEERSKEEMEEETDKGVKLAWSEIKAAAQPTGSQQSLQGQWQQDLKMMIKEEQDNDEKEAIGR